MTHSNVLYSPRVREVNAQHQLVLLVDSTVDTNSIGGGSPVPTTEQGKLALAMAALINVDLTAEQLSDSSDVVCICAIFAAIAFFMRFRAVKTCFPHVIHQQKEDTISCPVYSLLYHTVVTLP